MSDSELSFPGLSFESVGFQSLATCGLPILPLLCLHWTIHVRGELHFWSSYTLLTLNLYLGHRWAFTLVWTHFHFSWCKICCTVPLCVLVCIEWHACVGWRTLRHRRTPTKLIWSHSDWLVTLLLPLLLLLLLYTTSASTNTRSAMTTFIASASTTNTTSFGLVSHPSEFCHGHHHHQ